MPFGIGEIRLATKMMLSLLQGHAAGSGNVKVKSGRAKKGRILRDQPNYGVCKEADLQLMRGVALDKKGADLSDRQIKGAI